MAEPSTRHTGIRRAGVGAAALGGTTAVASAAGSVAAAAYFARRVLTPDRARPDDTVIRDVRRDSIVLEANDETTRPGYYGLWLDGGAGHARLGSVIAGTADGLIERELVGLDAGMLAPGPARWNSYYYAFPPDESLGLPTRHISISGELGPMPAWVVPPSAPSTPSATAATAATTTPETGGERWAILVHGRGARREETVRAIPVLHAGGWTCLVPNYRNDEGVPSGPDGRYNLGLSEWRDIEQAAAFAIQHGARELLLVGWSMGGAISLQFLNQSPLARLVSGVVLDGPVIDWGDVLLHHANLNYLPRPVARLSGAMMGRRWGMRLVGVHESVDVARTDWVRRADELRHRILIIHSADDEFVPIGPSRALAQTRPDLVRLEEWEDARHCKEWNTDRARWEQLVAQFSASATG
jgi:pimeloyl-ACP methyl ester carboxylesterase